MKFCPKCNGLIGDNVNTCPVCNYQLTEEDNKRIKDEKEESEVKQNIDFQEVLNKRAKKRLVLSILALGFLFGSLFIGGLVAKATGSVESFGICVAVGAVLEIATIIIGIANGALTCPHCGAILYRNYGKCCMHCGKRLR